MAGTKEISITIKGIPDKDGILDVSWSTENFEYLWDVYQMVKVMYATTIAVNNTTNRQTNVLPMKLKPTDTNAQLKKKVGEKLFDMEYFKKQVGIALQEVNGGTQAISEEEQDNLLRRLRKELESMGQTFDSDDDFIKFINKSFE